MRKVTRGAVVVGCETVKQASKLKEEIAKNLGEKYIIQELYKNEEEIEDKNIWH